MHNDEDFFLTITIIYFITENKFMLILKYIMFLLKVLSGFVLHHFIDACNIRLMEAAMLYVIFKWI